MAFHTILDSGNALNMRFNDGLPTMDDGLAFYLSQLSFLESKVYEVKYANIIWQDLIPVINVPEYVDEWNYMSFDGTTKADFIGSSAMDLPLVDVENALSSSKVFQSGIAYEYSIDELRKAQALRINLDQTKMQQAVRGVQEHIQEVAFTGNSARSITGLFNDALVNVQTSTSDFSNDAQAARVFLQNIMSTMWQSSKMVNVANLLLLPPSVFALLDNTPSIVVANGAAYQTELQFLKNNNIYTSITGAPLNIRAVNQLETAGANGGLRCVAYELNDENLALPMSVSQRFLPPQPRQLMLNIPSECRFGGVGLRYPGAFIYGDNLGG